MCDNIYQCSLNNLIKYSYFNSFCICKSMWHIKQASALPLRPYQPINWEHINSKYIYLFSCNFYVMLVYLSIKNKYFKDYDYKKMHSK